MTLLARWHLITFSLIKVYNQHDAARIGTLLHNPLAYNIIAFSSSWIPTKSDMSWFVPSRCSFGIPHLTSILVSFKVPLTRSYSVTYSWRTNTLSHKWTPQLYCRIPWPIKRLSNCSTSVVSFIASITTPSACVPSRKTKIVHKPTASNNNKLLTLHPSPI